MRISILFMVWIAFSCVAYAQYDTVIVEHKIGSSEEFNLNRFKYIRPTLLVLKAVENNKVLAKYYYKYKDGKLNGNYYVLNARGFCTDSGAYVNGLGEGLVKKNSYDNGGIYMLYYLKAGKQEGLLTRYSYDGSISQTETYVDNLKNGKDICYYGNGVKAIEKTYRNGILVDTVYKWFSNGEPKSIRIMDKTGMELYARELFFRSFEDNFGIGVVNYCSFGDSGGDENSKQWQEKRHSAIKRYYLYEHPHDKNPAKGLDGANISLFFNRYLGKSEIRLAEANILIKKDQGKWLQVIVGVHDNYMTDVRTLWIRKSVLDCDYQLWGKFLVGEGDKYCKIINLKENPVRESPQDGSPLISCQHSKCWKIIEVKGEWLRVVMDELDECSMFKIRKDKSCLAGGWIRWRDDRQLLVTDYMDPDPQ